MGVNYKTQCVLNIRPFLLCIGCPNVDNNSVLLSPKSNNVKQRHYISVISKEKFKMKSSMKSGFKPPSNPERKRGRTQTISGYMHEYQEYPISGFPSLLPAQEVELPVFWLLAFYQNGGRRWKFRCCGCRFLHDRPREVGLATALASPA